ncbi:hypothetical protein, partial [Litorimonas sp.]|uniref:hypothetical protein n=1 Tax=Litorimonas sp. TaxID=1892381 RepID=UPI003A8B6843
AGNPASQCLNYNLKFNSTCTDTKLLHSTNKINTETNSANVKHFDNAMKVQSTDFVSSCVSVIEPHHPTLGQRSTQCVEPGARASTSQSTQCAGVGVGVGGDLVSSCVSVVAPHHHPTLGQRSTQCMEPGARASTSQSTQCAGVEVGVGGLSRGFLVAAQPTQDVRPETKEYKIKKPNKINTKLCINFHIAGIVCKANSKQISQGILNIESVVVASPTNSNKKCEENVFCLNDGGSSHGLVSLALAERMTEIYLLPEKMSMVGLGGSKVVEYWCTLQIGSPANSVEFLVLQDLQFNTYMSSPRTDQIPQSWSAQPGYKGYLAQPVEINVIISACTPLLLADRIGVTKTFQLFSSRMNAGHRY